MLHPVPRTRNAAATRAALLESAKRRFATLGYDGASMRDVAADAGVDAALVVRYFGSKDELFAQVLSSMDDDGAWMNGEPETFGDRMAEELVFGECSGDCMDPVLVMIRSIGAARAQEALVDWCDETFHGPLKLAIGGGEQSDARAKLAGAMILGVAVMRLLRDDLGLDAAGRQIFQDQLAELLQSCAKAPKLT